MSDSVVGGVQGPASCSTRRVTGGIQQTADQAQQVVRPRHDGVGEVREVIRAQPITSALVVFALGYLFGRLGSLIPSARWPRR